MPLENPSIQTHLVLLRCIKHLCIFVPKGAIQIRYYYSSYYPNINRGTYVPATVCACDTRCHGKAPRVAALSRRVSQQSHLSRRSRGLVSHAAKPRPCDRPCAAPSSDPFSAPHQHSARWITIQSLLSSVRCILTVL